MTVPGDSAATQVIRRSRVAQESSEVIAARTVGAFRHLTLVAPGVAESAGPGQLVAVAVGGPGAELPLRRLVLLHRATPSGAYGGTVELVIDPADPTTAWLAARRPHDQIDVVGPLGRRFPLPSEALPCVVVGEGAGGGALLWLAEVLRTRGCRVDLVLGGESARRLLGFVDARRLCDGVTVTTLDGSAGVHGEPADVLPTLLERSRAAVVYAAGPLSLLRATAAAAERAGAVSMVAVNGPGGSVAGCGTGVCAGCVVPVRDEGGGVTHLVRSCTEGPVLRGDRVRWDALVDGRWRIPSDARSVAPHQGE